MSISVERCFLNPNWFTHVDKKVETLDNIKDSNNLLAIVARAIVVVIRQVTRLIFNYGGYDCNHHSIR